jgi:hypothetical protein
VPRVFVERAAQVVARAGGLFGRAGLVVLRHPQHLRPRSPGARLGLRRVALAQVLQALHRLVHGVGTGLMQLRNRAIKNGVRMQRGQRQGLCALQLGAEHQASNGHAHLLQGWAVAGQQLSHGRMCRALPKGLAVS